MCCCGTPVVNGELGYKWNSTDKPGVRPVDPPSLKDNDQLLRDEPGRCGGLDSHCHHYRLVKSYGSLILLVRHVGGVSDCTCPGHWPPCWTTLTRLLVIGH